MARRSKPFWALDSESDPFESDTKAVARRACPECGVAAGVSCRIARGEKRKVRTHERRRRVPVPFIWGLWGGPSGCEYHVFTTVQQVVDFLRDKPHIVYAHNGGKFDYHYLKEHVNTDETISIICGRLARFKIGVCEFRDSMNILPVALRKFKKDDFNYDLLEPDVRDLPENVPLIAKYLKSDCFNLYELVSAHRAENGVTLTQAGASMRKWAKMAKVSPPKQSASDYHYYKRYYYGGRVQCLEYGNKTLDFKVLDINSAYPQAMLHEHPFSPQGAVLSELPKRESDYHKCLITLDCTARSCFPFRTGKDPTKGDLYFPHDERTVREYNVTGYEFVMAQEMNAISNIKIKTVHRFLGTVKFEEYIQQQWDKRAAAKAAGNAALDIIYKLLMNSLYGKFASDYSKYLEYVICHLDEVLDYVREGYDPDPVVWCEGKRLMERPIPDSKHRYYNIATAASITGYVRAKLFQALMQVERPLYCDTDSIACVGVGSLQVGAGKGLGEWKDEGSFDRYSIAGKKTYAFHRSGHPLTLDLNGDNEYEHWKVACKGVDADPEQIHQVASGQPIDYSPEVPTYSLKRQQPTFIDRRVRLTARDIRRVPEPMETA